MGVQVQADYCDSTRCYIVAGKEALYIYAEAAEQSIMGTKRGHFSELRISGIASAGLSGIIQQTLIGLAYVAGSAGPIPLPLHGSGGSRILKRGV